MSRASSSTSPNDVNGRVVLTYLWLCRMCTVLPTFLSSSCCTRFSSPGNVTPRVGSVVTARSIARSCVCSNPCTASAIPSSASRSPTLAVWNAVRACCRSGSASRGNAQRFMEHRLSGLIPLPSNCIERESPSCRPPFSRTPMTPPAASVSMIARLPLAPDSASVSHKRQPTTKPFGRPCAGPEDKGGRLRRNRVASSYGGMPYKSSPLQMMNGPSTMPLRLNRASTSPHGRLRAAGSHLCIA
mmetsp:Transcript_34093/g.61127  ORF Transcript_34093/g.61127 Transcript_34093/m.61127 type:complete len:243 (+) Transcript_34093:1062-1790(+)